MDSISNILSAQTNTFFPTNPTIGSTPAVADMPENNNFKADTTLSHQSEKTNLNLDAIKTGLQSLKIQLEAILELIEENKGASTTLSPVTTPKTITVPVNIPHLESSAPIGLERVLEGIFNGEKMVGRDGKEYSVPPNYASKSKLVEGDTMKLTITQSGSFVYKQINQVARVRMAGRLSKDDVNNQWKVDSHGKIYRILTASVTFYHGKSGDEVFFLVPKDKISDWGAVENIVSNY